MLWVYPNQWSYFLSSKPPRADIPHCTRVRHLYCLNINIGMSTLLRVMSRATREIASGPDAILSIAIAMGSIIVQPKIIASRYTNIINAEFKAINSVQLHAYLGDIRPS